MFCTFWLQNVLRATTACTFSTSEFPKVVRSWCVLYILTSKFASRHNGVQFFISHLASWLRTRRFSEPTFRPSGATNHWKNTVFRDFPTFSRICIFFLLTLSLLWSALFYSSLLSASSHLCFSSVHIVVWLLNFLRLCIYIYIYAHSLLVKCPLETSTWLFFFIGLQHMAGLLRTHGRDSSMICIEDMMGREITVQCICTWHVCL